MKSIKDGDFHQLTPRLGVLTVAGGLKTTVESRGGDAGVLTVAGCVLMTGGSGRNGG